MSEPGGDQRHLSDSDITAMFDDLQQQVTAGIGSSDESVTGAAASTEDQELADWVSWLCETYNLGPVLRQWYQIPSLRQELAGFKRAYEADTAFQPMNLIVWHDNLDRFIGRIERHRQRWESDQRAAEEAVRRAERERQSPDRQSVK